VKRAGKEYAPQKIRTNPSLVRKSYGDVYMRILLAAFTLRDRSATQTPPPVRRKVVRIFLDALRLRNLGTLGHSTAAVSVLLAKEPFLPAPARTAGAAAEYGHKYTI
jgi:hypothetical protein